MAMPILHMRKCFKMSAYFCRLCQKDCHFRSRFDRHVRSASHRLQENVQKITSESRKRSAPTLELPGGCTSCEARTDSPSASDVQPVQVDVVNSSEEEVSDHSDGDIAQSSDTEEIGLFGVCLSTTYYNY